MKVCINNYFLLFLFIISVYLLFFTIKNIVKSPSDQYKYKLTPFIDTLILCGICLMGIFNLVNNFIAIIFWYLYFIFFYYINVKLPRKILMGVYLPDKSLLLNNAKAMNIFRIDSLEKFYYELANIYAIAIDKNYELAIEKINLFRAKNFPNDIKPLVENSQYTFYAYSDKYQNIIDELESIHNNEPNQLSIESNLILSRAYLELNNYEMALKSLNSYFSFKPKLNKNIFAFIFLPQYAFVGDIAMVKKLMAIINQKAYVLPGYFTNYWLGLTAIRQNNKELASEYINRLLSFLKNTQKSVFWADLYNNLAREVTDIESLHKSINQDSLDKYKIALDNFRNSLKFKI